MGARPSATRPYFAACLPARGARACALAGARPPPRPPPASRRTACPSRIPSPRTQRRRRRRTRRRPTKCWPGCSWRSPPTSTNSSRNSSRQAQPLPLPLLPPPTRRDRRGPPAPARRRRRRQRSARCSLACRWVGGRGRALLARLSHLHSFWQPSPQMPLFSLCPAPQAAETRLLDHLPPDPATAAVVAAAPAAAAVAAAASAAPTSSRPPRSGASSKPPSQRAASSAARTGLSPPPLAAATTQPQPAATSAAVSQTAAAAAAQPEEPGIGLGLGLGLAMADGGRPSHSSRPQSLLTTAHELLLSSLHSQGGLLDLSVSVGPTAAATATAQGAAGQGLVGGPLARVRALMVGHDGLQEAARTANRVSIRRLLPLQFVAQLAAFAPVSVRCAARDGVDAPHAPGGWLQMNREREGVSRGRCARRSSSTRCWGEGLQAPSTSVSAASVTGGAATQLPL